MVNKLGPLTFEIVAQPPVPLTGNSLRLEGYFDEREELLQLQEMFKKCRGGTAIYQMLEGIEKGYDVTEDSVLTQYCEFDIDQLQNGYYLLRKLDCNFKQMPEYYPFSIELFFLGTEAFYQYAYQIYQFEELTNDWSI